MVEFFNGSLFLFHKRMGIHIKGDGNAGMAEQFADGLHIHSQLQGRVAKVCPYAIITLSPETPVKSRVRGFGVILFHSIPK
jgi:hypothetical protein